MTKWMWSGVDRDQLRQLVEQQRVVQQMQVLDQKSRVGKIGQLLDQSRDEVVARGEAGRLHLLERRLADRGIDGAHGVDESVRESDGVVVRRFDRQPGSRAFAAHAGPLGQQHRLAGPRRCDEQNDSTAPGLVESADQMVATDRGCRNGRLCRADPPRPFH